MLILSLCIVTIAYQSVRILFPSKINLRQISMEAKMTHTVFIRPVQAEVLRDLTLHRRSPRHSVHRAPRRRQAPCQRASICSSSKQMSTCCNCMFHAFQMYVACVSFGCCKSRSGVTYVAMLYMYVASVCFKYFNYFRYTLQVYVPNVSVVSHVCCKCFIWMLQ
jgi:hypothetical protein